MDKLNCMKKCPAILTVNLTDMDMDYEWIIDV
jgi:hypothetical protein